MSRRRSWISVIRSRLRHASFPNCGRRDSCLERCAINQVSSSITEAERIESFPSNRAGAVRALNHGGSMAKKVHPTGGRRRAVPGNRDFARVPTTMRAAAIDRFGGPNVLKLQILPVPSLAPDEVLIAVHTAGVGSWDAEMRAGWSPDGTRPRFPFVLGTDGSGTIAAVGSRVRRFAVGDHVYAYSFANPKGGFYAEYVAVAAVKVGLPPSLLTMREAGAI